MKLEINKDILIDENKGHIGHIYDSEIAEEIVKRVNEYEEMKKLIIAFRYHWLDVMGVQQPKSDVIRRLQEIAIKLEEHRKIIK